MPASIFSRVIVAKYERAKRSLCAAWRLGTTAWLREHAVGRLMAIEIADVNLCAVWQRAEVSACTESEFDAALESWRAACAAAIDEFQMSEAR